MHCETVDLAAVARLYGTPTYVYSAGTVEDNYRRLAAPRRPGRVRCAMR